MKTLRLNIRLNTVLKMGLHAGILAAIASACTTGSAVRRSPSSSNPCLETFSNEQPSSSPIEIYYDRAISPADFSKRLDRQKSKWTKLSSPLVLDVGMAVSADFIIGDSSSLVLLDSQHRLIVKIYAAEARVLALYEKLAGEFLSENRETLSHVVAVQAGKIDNLPDEVAHTIHMNYNGPPRLRPSLAVIRDLEYTVVIKEYYEGLTLTEIPANGSQVMLDMKAAEYEERYFKSGKFYQWANERYPNETRLIEHSQLAHLLRKGNVEPFNFLLTRSGAWILNDF